MLEIEADRTGWLANKIDCTEFECTQCGCSSLVTSTTQHYDRSWLVGFLFCMNVNQFFYEYLQQNDPQNPGLAGFRDSRFQYRLAATLSWVPRRLRLALARHIGRLAPSRMPTERAAIRTAMARFPGVILT